MAGIPFVFAGKFNFPYSMIYYIPPITFFLTMLLVLIKKRRVSELVNILLLASVLSVGYMMHSGTLAKITGTNFNSIYPVNDPIKSFPPGYKIVYLGDDFNFYQYPDLVTPYLNYSLTKYFLDRLPGNPERIAEFNEEIKKSRPDLIIDEYDILKKSISELTYLSEKYQYEQVENKGMYRLLTVIKN
jgi:hypothetical protein